MRGLAITGVVFWWLMAAFWLFLTIYTSDYRFAQKAVDAAQWAVITYLALKRWIHLEDRQ